MLDHLHSESGADAEVSLMVRDIALISTLVAYVRDNGILTIGFTLSCRAEER